MENLENFLSLVFDEKFAFKKWHKFKRLREEEERASERMRDANSSWMDGIAMHVTTEGLIFKYHHSLYE